MTGPYPGTLTANLLTFAHLLREAELLVGPQEVALGLQALSHVDLHDREEVRLALRGVFVGSPLEGARFDTLFERYWRGGLLMPDETRPEPTPNLPQPKRLENPSVRDWSAKETHDDTVDTAGYSTFETLVKTDFAAVSTDEVGAVSRLVVRLAKRLATKVSRRYRASARQGEVADVRRTLRRSLGRGGEPLELVYKRRALGKTRLLFLFDVSGSMMIYSGFLLQVAYAFVQLRSLGRTEVFGFATDLYRLTPHLQTGGPAGAIRAARRAMPGRSGGTKIGSSLRAFLERHSTLLDHKTVVIIVSDGWDTGELDVLRDAMRTLKSRSARVLWLNPLAGSAGYTPTAGGMQVALPFVDVFAPAHNLESLRALEGHLVRGSSR